MRALQKRRKPVGIGEVLKEVIGDLEASKKIDIEEASVILRKVVPKKLISHLSLRKKIREKLVIHVDDPAWLYGAYKYKEKILERMRLKVWGKEIKEIYFRVGKTG